MNEIWGEENVNRVIGRDIWATFEAVIKARYESDSERHKKGDPMRIHYVPIDDAALLAEARRTGSKMNVNVNAFYREVRHELEKHAIKTGGHAGGIVYCPLIAQEYYSIDIGLREAAPLVVFKSHDRVLDTKEYNFVDPKIKKALRKIYFESSLTCDYFYRKLAVGIDAEQKYTWFYADPDVLPYVSYKDISGEDLFERQKDELVQYLVDNFDYNAKSWYLKGKLKQELRKQKREGVILRIYDSDLIDIVDLARTEMKDAHDKEEEESSKTQDTAQKNQSDGWTIKLQIVIWHESDGLSFDGIEQKYGIPHSTAHKWYVEARKYMDQLKNREESKVELSLKDFLINKFGINEEESISMKDVVFYFLINKIGVNKVLTSTKESLKKHISDCVDPRFYLGENGIDAMTGIIYNEAQNKKNEYGKEALQELVIKPLKEMKVLK